MNEEQIRKLRASMVDANCNARLIWTLQKFQLGNFINEKTTVTINLADANAKLLQLTDPNDHREWLRELLNA